MVSLMQMWITKCIYAYMSTQCIYSEQVLLPVMIKSEYSTITVSITRLLMVQDEVVLLFHEYGFQLLEPSDYHSALKSDC